MKLATEHMKDVVTALADYTAAKNKLASLVADIDTADLPRVHWSLLDVEQRKEIAGILNRPVPLSLDGN